MPERAASGSERLAIGAALVTVVLWASAFVGIRAAADDLSPGSIALGRLTVGALALGVLVAARPWVRPTRRELVYVVGAGLTWFAAYNIILGEAERLVDAGTAAMLVGTGPIFIALLAGTFLGEGFPPRLLAGCAAAFTGTVIIGLATTSDVRASATTPLGIALCIAAALLYAAGVTFQKPALRTIPALQLTWLSCLVGAIVCLPYAPALIGEIGRSQPENVAWVIYLGVFPTSIGFTTWGFALSRMSAGRAGALLYLISPTVIAIGWLLLGETPAGLAILGGVLCVAGVVAARSSALRIPVTFTRRRQNADPGSPRDQS